MPGASAEHLSPRVARKLATSFSLMSRDIHGASGASPWVSSDWIRDVAELIGYFSAPAFRHSTFESLAIKHPNTPSDVLWAIRASKDPQNQLDTTLMAHPNADRELLDTITHEWIGNETRRPIAFTIMWFAVPGMLKNPHLSPVAANEWVEYLQQVCEVYAPNSWSSEWAAQMLGRALDPSEPVAAKLTPEVVTGALVCIARQ